MAPRSSDEARIRNLMLNYGYTRGEAEEALRRMQEQERGTAPDPEALAEERLGATPPGDTPPGDRDTGPIDEYDISRPSVRRMPAVP